MQEKRDVHVFDIEEIGVREINDCIEVKFLFEIVLGEQRHAPFVQFSIFFRITIERRIKQYI